MLTISYVYSEYMDIIAVFFNYFKLYNEVVYMHSYVRRHNAEKVIYYLLLDRKLRLPSADDSLAGITLYCCSLS